MDVERAWEDHWRAIRERTAAPESATGKQICQVINGARAFKGLPKLDPERMWNSHPCGELFEVILAYQKSLAFLAGTGRTWQDALVAGATEEALRSGS